MRACKAEQWRWKGRHSPRNSRRGVRGPWSAPAIVVQACLLIADYSSCRHFVCVWLLYSRPWRPSQPCRLEPSTSVPCRTDHHLTRPSKSASGVEQRETSQQLFGSCFVFLSRLQLTHTAWLTRLPLCLLFHTLAVDLCF